MRLPLKVGTWFFVSMARTTSLVASRRMFNGRLRFWTAIARRGNAWTMIPASVLFRNLALSGSDAEDAYSMVWPCVRPRSVTQGCPSLHGYLIDFWEPNDRVFLFGFSRGAYTARVLAGLLHQLGLLPRGNYNLIPVRDEIFSSHYRSASPAI